MQLLGMAGLAEAAMAQAIAILLVGLILLWGLITLVIWKKSVTAAGVVLLIVLVSAVIFQPWTGLLPVHSQDGDVHYWAARFRFVDTVWFITFGASIALFVWTKRRANHQRDSTPSRPERHLRRLTPPWCIDA